MKIDEFCTYAAKSGIKAGEATKDGEYMFFTSSEDESKRYSDYQFDGEGIIMGTGGNATLHYYCGKYAVSTDCVVLLPDERVRCKYLYYFLLANMPLLEAGFKGAGLRHTNKKYIGSIEIGEIPPLYEQDNAINALDRIVGIVQRRSRELTALDDLIKARFVEMFGDPEAGTCPFQTEKLRDLSVKISDGVHAKPDYTETGRPFLSVVNINRGVVDFTDCKFVSEEAYQKMIKSTYPQKGDVLYTKVGATYGIPAYVDTEREFCLYVSVCLIKPAHEKINARFLALQMAMPSVKHQADARIKGIGVPDLHLNQISEFNIVCPPRNLQDEFVHFVAQVDKSKVAVQKASDETQLLFDSLMQDYFG